MIRWLDERRARTKLRRSIALRVELSKADGPTSVFELARRARVPIEYADYVLELWWIADLLVRTTAGHSEHPRHTYELTTKGRTWVLAYRRQSPREVAA
jgi:hypothetical protein